MEYLVPPMKLLMMVKKSLDRGLSVRSGLNQFLQDESDPWRDQVFLWLMKFQQGLPTGPLLDEQSSPYRSQLLKLLERGLRGESIRAPLVELESEMMEQIELQIDRFTGRLPYFLLVPLAFFLFPACLILMLGPFILQLLESF